MRVKAAESRKMKARFVFKTMTQIGRRKSEIRGAVMMLGSWPVKQNENST